MEPYQVLPLRVRVDQGVIAMKGYSTFPKVLYSLVPYQDTHWVGRSYASAEIQSADSTVRVKSADIISSIPN